MHEKIFFMVERIFEADDYVKAKECVEELNRKAEYPVSYYLSISEKNK
nr:MAG TPA: hypothetical protein [Caudoviricetes sp.]